MQNLLAASINGEPVANMAAAVNLEERGLHYGDGLFETMLLRQGNVAAFERHMQRLAVGCERLAIAQQDGNAIEQEIKTLVRQTSQGIVKLIVTRGGGGRGYRGVAGATSNRMLMLYPYTPEIAPAPLTVRWCTTRLARNPLLAGVKHLNRLEQVLAQREWQDASIGEGLMLDLEDELVCATAGNLFVATEGALCTPDLRFSGVRGTMRARVLDVARELGYAVEECALRPQQLLDATEVFVTNAVRGIRPVTALEDRRWPIGALTRRLANALELW